MATGSKLRSDVIRLGLFDHLDNEVAVWPGRSDWGDLGWFLGKESNYDEDELARGREDALFPSVFFEGDDAKERAVAAGKKRESHDRWNRRETGEDDTECLEAWDKADMAALGFIEEGA